MSASAFDKLTDDELVSRRLVELAGKQPSPSPDDGDAVDAFAGMPTDSLTDAGSENAEVFVEELDHWLEVRTRYLTWVDGRLAQMVIASDITARRNAESTEGLHWPSIVDAAIWARAARYERFTTPSIGSL